MNEFCTNQTSVSGISLFFSFFLSFSGFCCVVICLLFVFLLLFGSLLTCHDFVRRRWWFPGIRDFFPHIWTVFVIIIIHEWSSLVNESRIGLFMFMVFHCFVQCLHFFYVRLNNHQFSFHSSIHPFHSIPFRFVILVPVKFFNEKKNFHWTPSENKPSAKITKFLMTIIYRLYCCAKKIIQVFSKCFFPLN